MSSIDRYFGTADAIILAEDQITIVDLKYGLGVKVYAENNEQLMLYALGAVQKYSEGRSIKSVRMIIVQPRLSHISDWTISIDDLNHFADEVRKTASVALTSNGEQIH